MNTTTILTYADKRAKLFLSVSTCAHNGHVPVPTTVMYPCPQRPCTRAHNGHVSVPTTLMYLCPPRSCT